MFDAPLEMLDSWKYTDFPNSVWYRWYTMYFWQWTKRVD